MNSNDAIDQAALVFDADMGKAPPRPVAEKESKGRPIEQVFSNLGELTADSEKVAGGDEASPLIKKQVKKVEEEDEGPEVFEDDEGQYTIGEDGERVPVEVEEDDKDDEEEEDEDFKKEVVVMVDGEEVTVTIDEAIKGYIRTETLHRRLNQVNEVTQVLSKEAEAIVADRQKYIKLLADTEEEMKLLLPAEPNWDELFKVDAAKAREYQKQYETFKTNITDIRTKREKAEKEAQDADAKSTSEFAKSEFQRFAQVAGWKSKEDMGKDTSSMRRTAIATGFTDQELAVVYDSRMLTVLLKASKYDRMMANKPKAVKRVSSSSTPGAGSVRTAHTGTDRAMKRLSRTGNVEDAAAVFANMLTRSKPRG